MNLREPLLDSLWGHRRLPCCHLQRVRLEQGIVGEGSVIGGSCVAIGTPLMLSVRIKSGWILDKERWFLGRAVQALDRPFVRIEEGGEMQSIQGRARTAWIAS